MKLLGAGHPITNSYLTRRGQTLLKLPGQFKSAVVAFEKAAAVAGQCQNLAEQATNEFLLAFSRMRCGQAAHAVQAAERAVQLWTRVSGPSDKSRLQALVLLGDLQRERFLGSRPPSEDAARRAAGAYEDVLAHAAGDSGVVARCLSVAFPTLEVGLQQNLQTRLEAQGSALDVLLDGDPHRQREVVGLVQASPSASRPTSWVLHQVVDWLSRPDARAEPHPALAWARAFLPARVFVMGA